MKRVKRCMRTFRVCSFTAWFSLLKCIKNDHKIQDMREENVYIFTFHIVKITQRVQFFSSKISMITNVILILYNSSINNKLNQIKSNHFYCHITTAQVPWWVKFLWACSRQCKKTTDNLPMDRQCKKTTNNLHMDRQCKKTTNNLPMDRQCKKTTNNLPMDRQCKKTALEHLQCSRQCKKKTTAIYIWTDSAKNNSNLHMDSTYLQTVQKTMCKIHIHILSTLSVL